MVPIWLSKHCAVRHHQGRPAHAAAGRTPWTTNNPAAFRVEIRGQDRQLRIKQFLYDWAFPALDHPSLWKSQTSAEKISDQHIVWHGIDYRGKSGASARLTGTTVELSVLEGSFSRDEITDLYRSLRPVDPGAAEAIASTPFAMLSYWARHSDAPLLGVPLGLWQLHQPDDETITWTTAKQLRGSKLISAPERLVGLPLDSVAIYHGHSYIEREYLYRGERGRELRLHELNSDQVAQGIQPSSHPANHERIASANHHIRLGYINEAYGPFDALIEDHEERPKWRVLASTDTRTNRAWFLNALSELLSAL